MHLQHAVLHAERQATWKDPVEVTILHLLIVLILLQAEGRVRQVPVNETSLLCFGQTLHVSINQLMPGRPGMGTDNIA